MAEPVAVTGWEYFFKYIVPAATGIITVAIAGATVFIAKKQFEINKAQKELLTKKQALETEDHQLKKYDRTIDTFIALEGFFENFEIQGKFDLDDVAHFYKNVWPNRFLFSKEIKEYFCELRDAMFKSTRLSTKLKYTHDKTSRLKMQTEEDELMHWFVSQRESLDEKFEPYLLVQQ